LAVQLPLDCRPPSGADLEHFITDGAAPYLPLLRAMAAGQGEPQLLLWGGTGVGKTLLLTGTCALASASGRTAAYLPLAELSALDTALLTGLEEMPLIACDDCQAIAGDRAWETALFHLYNRVRARGGRLLFAADQPPQGLPLQLADLRSRLGWGGTFRIAPLGDQGKELLLLREASRRGLRLDQGVASYLLHHCPRDTAGLLAIFDRIDQLAMSEQRRLTLPFVRDRLQSLGLL